MFAARTLLRQSARPLARSFSVQTSVRKDFIQELYVKELKAYKPSPAPSAAGSVKSYSTPATPAAPSIPDAAALAKELEEYDAYTPAADTPAPSAAAVEAGEGHEGADEYLKLVEADVQHEAKH